MTEPVVVPGGARIAWDTEGSGADVLLVHGIGSTRRRWEPQMGPLVEAGFRITRMDLRGFGDSEAPPGPASMEDFVADLEGFIEARRLERFHLVGHSLGGMIAQKYVLRAPDRVRSLVLVSTTSHNGRRATAFARLMVSLAEHGFDAVFEDPSLRAEATAILAEAFPRGIDVTLLKPGMETPNEARANAWRACIDYSTKDRLSEIRCPVFVAHGTADFLIPFRSGEFVHHAIAHSEWRAEPGAGHSLTRERSRSFNEALLGFLGRVEGRDLRPRSG